MQAKHIPETVFDATRRYVRVCEQRPDGFVEFEFAIGDPALCVELMLKEADFHEFCLSNDVIVLEHAEAGQGDWAARLNKASQQGFARSGEPDEQGGNNAMTRGDIHGN